MQRREFLKGAAWVGAAAAISGCADFRLGFGDGGSMCGFRMKPLKRVRVGFIGLGGRGYWAVRRIALIPGVDIVALCDRKRHRVDMTAQWLRESKRPEPRAFVGDEAWKALCDADGIDVVYIATPWAFHAEMAIRTMRCGKVPLVEVPAAMTVDECWDLVETSERLKIPCMQLENCCYGEFQLLGLNLTRLGKLGELMHAEGAYIHDLRDMCDDTNGREGECEWRYGENRVHKGNRYPTHGLVPVMQAMNVNRGDRFDYLVSLECDQAAFELYKESHLLSGNPRRGERVEMGDMNSTLVRTVRGKSILVQHDVSSPRGYSLIDKLSGTKGIFWGMPWRTHDVKTEFFKCAWEEKNHDRGARTFFDDKRTAEVRERYMHPLWKQVGEIAKKVGGHGGMDFIMDLRWAYCLQNGLPLDMDVYDLAASCSLCELTEESVRSGSKPVDVPDFTRGAWKTMNPLEIVTCDLSKIDFGDVRNGDRPMDV